MTELFKIKAGILEEMFLEAARNAILRQVSILSDAAFHWKGVATLIHIMNPECIVLSGRV